MTDATQRRGAGGQLSILHLHGRFDGSAKDARILRLMNHWGSKARHDLLLADPLADSARAGIDPVVPVTFLDGPAFGPHGGPGRFMALAQAMRAYDLVLSFGWGGIDGVITQRMFGLLMNLPPLIHHEDGSDLDVVGPLGLSSDFYRRMAFGAAYALVVPTGQLAHVAIDHWGEAPQHVRQIPDGIDVAAYAGKRPAAVIPGLVDDGRLVLGACVDDASPPMLDQLLRAVAPLRMQVRLVLLDAPGESEALAARAAALGIDDLLSPHDMPPPSTYLGALDLFARLALAQPGPRGLAEAMAAGLPVIATDVGDVSEMLASANRPFIVKPGDDAALAVALSHLAGDADLRGRLGQANRARAAQCFDVKVMFDLYSRLYGSAVDREDALL